MVLHSLMGACCTGRGRLWPRVSWAAGRGPGRGCQAAAAHGRWADGRVCKGDAPSRLCRNAMISGPTPWCSATFEGVPQRRHSVATASAQEVPAGRRKLRPVRIATCIAGGGHPEGPQLRPQHRAVLRGVHPGGLRPDAGHRVHGGCACLMAVCHQAKVLGLLLGFGAGEGLGAECRCPMQPGCVMLPSVLGLL
jgi:hypothetical protein